MTVLQRGWARALALLALGLVCCAPAPKTALVVGTVPWVGLEPLFLAREKGLFPGPIHLTEYMNSEHELRAFQNGVTHAMAVSLEEVLQRDPLGQQTQVVLVLDSSHGADCVVAQPGVKTLADLRGQRVASEDVMLSTYLLHRALEQVGLDLKAVERVFLAPEQFAAAFERREVAAVAAYEPFCQRLVAAGGHLLFDSAKIPGEIVDVLTVRKSVLQTNPEQVDALLRGWFAALTLMRAHPAESARLMGRRVRLDEGQFLEALKGVHYLGAEEQARMLDGERPRLQEAIERLGAVMRQRGALTKNPDASRLIDTQPLHRVTR